MSPFRSHIATWFGLLVLTSWFCAQASEDRPNLVWIVSEDNSIEYMNLYGDTLGPMPTIESLAREGLTFDNAFSNAPVCSVARTTLITGVYPPRIGAQYHRRAQPAQLPEGLKMLPNYLREAGYYATNRVKTDYNVQATDVWDESSKRASWRNRPELSTPFFHMQSTNVSHESSLHVGQEQLRGDALQTDPSQVEVPPYLPETELVRGTIARYHDRMKEVDKVATQIVDQLREDGLLENTFIFYFGDHGGVLPRSKGYLFDSGLHVPLVVRIPEAYRDQVRFEVGSRVSGFVSFVDFAPTMLALAGLDAPDALDGRAFLGGEITPEQVNQRNVTFGYGDRYDALYTMTRSVRVGNYKYLRHYMPYIPLGLQNNYRYKMLAFDQWRNLYREDRLDPVQARFFQPRPAEQLFDLSQDPHEVNDLSDNPLISLVVEGLRSRLAQHHKELPDLGFYPESVLVDEALPDGASYGQAHQDQIRRMIDVADLALLPFSEAVVPLGRAILDDDPWIRYWALIACSTIGGRANVFTDDARKLLNDPERLVRLRAAEFLTLLEAEEFDPRPTILEALNTSEDPVEAAIILNSIVYLRDDLGINFDVEQIRPQASNESVKRRLEYLRDELE